MHKLLVFDLDGTLAPVGLGIDISDIEKLRYLEKIGYKIAICSGKPTFYLCGFMRQVELEKPILIGENGGTFQFGVNLPPEKFYTYPCSTRSLNQIKTIKEEIDEKCSDNIWYQPNIIGLTPFPKENKTFEDIQQIVDENKHNLDEIIVYRHIDSFDFIPNNINKSNGLEYLIELEGLSKSDVIAIGDGVNDIPMFEYSDISISVGKKIDYSTDLVFNDISGVLDYIIYHKI